MIWQENAPTHDITLTKETIINLFELIDTHQQGVFQPLNNFNSSGFIYPAHSFKKRATLGTQITQELRGRSFFLLDNFR